MEFSFAPSSNLLPGAPSTERNITLPYLDRAPCHSSGKNENASPLFKVLSFKIVRAENQMKLSALPTYTGLQPPHLHASGTPPHSCWARVSLRMSLSFHGPERH